MTYGYFTRRNLVNSYTIYEKGVLYVGKKSQ